MRDPRTEIPNRIGDWMLPVAAIVWLGFLTGKYWLVGVIFAGAFVLNFLEYLFYRPERESSNDVSALKPKRPGSGD